MMYIVGIRYSQLKPKFYSGPHEGQDSWKYYTELCQSHCNEEVYRSAVTHVHKPELKPDPMIQDNEIPFSAFDPNPECSCNDVMHNHRVMVDLESGVYTSRLVVTYCRDCNKILEQHIYPSDIH